VTTDIHGNTHGKDGKFTGHVGTDPEVQILGLSGIAVLEPTVASASEDLAEFGLTPTRVTSWEGPMPTLIVVDRNGTEFQVTHEEYGDFYDNSFTPTAGGAALNTDQMATHLGLSVHQSPEFADAIWQLQATVGKPIWAAQDQAGRDELASDSTAEQRANLERHGMKVTGLHSWGSSSPIYHCVDANGDEWVVGRFHRGAFHVIPVSELDREPEQIDDFAHQQRLSPDDLWEGFEELDAVVVTNTVPAARDARNAIRFD
jgi:hypothetical protein